MENTAKVTEELDLQLENLQADHALLQKRFEETKRQLDWFKRELFFQYSIPVFRYKS